MNWISNKHIKNLKKMSEQQVLKFLEVELIKQLSNDTRLKVWQHSVWWNRFYFTNKNFIKDKKT